MALQLHTSCLPLCSLGAVGGDSDSPEGADEGTAVAGPGQAPAEGAVLAQQKQGEHSEGVL